jgi:hypothetical protein
LIFPSGKPHNSRIFLLLLRNRGHKKSGVPFPSGWGSKKHRVCVVLSFHLFFLNAAVLVFGLSVLAEFRAAYQGSFGSFPQK